MAGLSTARELSIQDLVILGLLAERGLHGYEIDRTLVNRGIRQWADLSRPQIYYSLKKLARLGLIGETQETDQDDPPGGPDRTIFNVTPKGTRQLRIALAREEWASRSATPPFATWLALSPMLPHAEALNVLRKREEFLKGEIASREARPTREAQPESADWGMDLILAQLRAELEFVRRGLKAKRSG